MIVPNERESNVNSLGFWPNREMLCLVLALPASNAFVGLALVAVSLLLMLAVSSVAWLYDRHKEIQPIRGRPERRALVARFNQFERI